jgi:hypothetical protein
VDNNYLDLGMNKSGFVHTLPSGRLTQVWTCLMAARVPDLPKGSDIQRFGEVATQIDSASEQHVQTPQSQHHISSGYLPALHGRPRQEG